jgi:shikimate 5-dehydrogenase
MLSTLSPMAVSFASATRGWVVGTGGAGRAVILATADGRRSWQSQLPA